MHGGAQIALRVVREGMCSPQVIIDRILGVGDMGVVVAGAISTSMTRSPSSLLPEMLAIRRLWSFIREREPP